MDKNITKVTYLLTIFFLSLFIVGCTSPISNNTQNLEATVQVIGNPQTFHTTFTQDNNSINITITQKPTKLVYYPKEEIPDFNIICYEEYGEIAFEEKLAKMWPAMDREKLAGDTIIRYYELRTYSLFNPAMLNYTNTRFYCKVKADIKLRHLEYIEGILVQNTTETCNFFWQAYNIWINCYEHCEYQFMYGEDANEFINRPEENMARNCFAEV